MRNLSSLLIAIKQRTQLTKVQEDLILNYFKYVEIEKNHQLLREDQFANKLYFLASGTIRTYYYHNDKEVTSWFYRENQFLSSWHSFINSEKSFEYIETLEKCTIYFITKQDYKKLLKADSIFEKFGRLLMEEQLAFIDYYFKGVLFMTAKEKYDLLLSYFPDITQKVNLGHIASFLGITQETLSRLRSLS